MSLLQSFDDDLASQPQPSSSKQKLSIVGGSLRSIPIDWSSLIHPQNLVSHSDGLCSSVYRIPLTSPPAKWPYDSSTVKASHALPVLELLANAVNEAGGLDGWICIKRVSPDDQPQPHSVSREIALLSSLPKHPNVAELLAAMYDETDPFGGVVDLVMPLYAATLEEVLLEPTLLPVSLEVGFEAEFKRAGKSVQHLWTKPNTPASFIADVTTQLLEALSFLHAQAVAHRDIKPSNILLSHTGVVKLIDLGTAYTTTSLADPLEPGKIVQSEAEQMVDQVGTGSFRAPELLFAPKNGYDPFAVDVWSLAVTMAHFFTPLTPVLHVDVVGDERKDWQKAFDSSTQWNDVDDESNSPLYWEEDPLPVELPPSTASGYIRTPLFEAERGDIGLAASIFSLLGLPKTIETWPEAADFQPPLSKLPFAATNGTGLLAALPLLKQFEASQEVRRVVEKVIVPSLHLSASKRPTTNHLLDIIKKRQTP